MVIIVQQIMIYNKKIIFANVIHVQYHHTFMLINIVKELKTINQNVLDIVIIFGIFTMFQKINKLIFVI